MMFLILIKYNRKKIGDELFPNGVSKFCRFFKNELFETRKDEVVDN